MRCIQYENEHSPLSTGHTHRLYELGEARIRLALTVGILRNIEFFHNGTFHVYGIRLMNEFVIPAKQVNELGRLFNSCVNQPYFTQ